MQNLSKSELQTFIDGNTVLFGTRERPGLMLTDNNEVVKSFYRRKLISSSTLIPQAQRFTTNSRKLLEKGITAPIVKDIIHCPEYPLHMVVYDRIDGKDLRELCDELGSSQLGLVPAYLAHLHEQGVFFRAIHLGNLVYNGDTLCLIDIADVKIRQTPLSVLQRARNIAHLINSDEDKARFTSYGVDRFLAEYLDTQHFNGLQRGLFHARLNWSLDVDMRPTRSE